MLKSIKLLSVVAVAGLVAAGGTAITASNGVMPETVAGYSTADVSGATVEGIKHTLSADGVTILSTLITFSASQELNTVTAGFGTTDLQDCLVAGTPFLTATCTYDPVGSFVTADATTFSVAVVSP